jgi:hypothetical protein
MPLKVNLAHHALDALCVVIDRGHVLPQDPAGYVLRGGGGNRGWHLLVDHPSPAGYADPGLLAT